MTLYFEKLHFISMVWFEIKLYDMFQLFVLEGHMLYWNQVLWLKHKNIIISFYHMRDKLSVYTLFIMVSLLSF